MKPVLCNVVVHEHKHYLISYDWCTVGILCFYFFCACLTGFKWVVLRVKCVCEQIRIV